MVRLWLAVLSLVAMLVLAGPGGVPVVLAQDLDRPVPGGRFYQQANGAGGAGTSGFSVVDGGVDDRNQPIPFYSAYQTFGGPAVLGYPISFRFRFAPADGFVYQAFQNGLLQWDPVTREVRLANLMDMLSAAGFDPQMEAWGYPRRQDDGSGGNFALAQAERLGWLETPGYADLAAAFRVRGEAILGLPGARPQTFGWIRALRTQRSVLSSQDGGAVRFAPAGDDAKRLGFLNGSPLVARGDDGDTAITILSMTAGSAVQGQPAPVSAAPPRYQYRVVYTETANTCERTLLVGDVRDAYGVPRNAVYFRTWNDQGNELFLMSGLDQPIPGTWIRDMGPGVHPGIWNVEIVSEPGGAKLSDTATVRFDATCDTPRSANVITIFFQENPQGAGS